MNWRMGIALCLGCLAFGCGAPAPKENDLLDQALTEMSSMTHLAYQSEEHWGMISSYDRNGGNNDGSFFESKMADGTAVLADLKGPGSVRRFWITGMPFGSKFYFTFDDEKTPRFVKTFEDLNGKGLAPFAFPLCDYPSGSVYCYLPITYAKRLVITTDPVKQGQFFFYHINYQTLPRNNHVKSLTLEDLERHAPKISAVGSVWVRSLSNLTEQAVLPVAGAEKALVPGQEITVLDEKGPAMLDELALQIKLPETLGAVERNAMLRALVLRVYWDGLTVPSVEVPFGDFFCNGVRPRSFRSMPMAVEGDTYVTRFPMPFQKHVRITLQNEANLEASVGVSVAKRPLAVWSGQELYLHAAWNQSIGRGVPHEILQVSGEGRYAGCYLVSIGMEASWNILEGDESIYRDGEALAGMHGTGLEDYFNGGWYYNGGIFTMPFAGVLERSGIRTTQFRFHVPDRVDFKKQIRVNIEFGHANASRGYMSSTAYWYAKTPAGVPFRLPAVRERLIPVDPLERGSILCELFEREKAGRLEEAIGICREYMAKYPGTPEAALMELRAVAYEERLKGIDAVRAAYLKLSKESPDAAVREQASMLAWFHEAPTNGIVAVHINGQTKVFLDGQMIASKDAPIDAYGIPVGLPPGKHVLALEVTATRPDPWVSVDVRGHNTNFWTDDVWQMAKTVSPGWMNLDGTKAGWAPAAYGGPLPWMRYFQFKPNGFVCAHYRKQLIYNPEGWQPGTTLYFRREFEIQP